MTLQLLPAFVLLGIPGSLGLWTVDKLSVRSGGSVTVPCHYHRMFRGHVKYWCRGKLWQMCVPVRESPGRISIIDSPAELVITLTLSNVQSRDAGRYWCAVKIRGFMKADVRTSLELQVANDALDLWVSNSTVSAPEGGNISIECFYGDKLKDTEKKWCRSGDLHSCQSVRDTRPSQHALLHLSDEGRGCFTVTLVGVQREDAGWYWCTAAGIQAPVHVTVTAAPTTPPCTDKSETSSPVASDQPRTNSSVISDQPRTTSSVISDKPQTSSPVASDQPRTTYSVISDKTRTTSSVISDKPRTSSPLTEEAPESTFSTWPTSPLAGLTIHPSVAPSVTNRVHIWVTVLVTGGILFTAATVTALVCRRRLQHRQTAMIDNRTEPVQDAVKDDVDLMDYEWTSSSVPEVDREASTTVLL